MLSYFPELLFLGRLSPTIIRVAVAIALLYAANVVLTKMYDYMQLDFPLIGRPPSWLLAFGATIMSIIGVALFVGSWAQPMALLSAIGAIKLAFLAKKYPAIAPFPVSSCLLLIAMSLSLVFTGAGAFAFDLPL